jgi:hypothetical protein
LIRGDRRDRGDRVESLLVMGYWLWVIEGLGGEAWGGAFDKNASAGDYFGFFV